MSNHKQRQRALANFKFEQMKYINDGYVTIYDMKKAIKAETGIDFD